MLVQQSDRAKMHGGMTPSKRPASFEPVASCSQYIAEAGNGRHDADRGTKRTKSATKTKRSSKHMQVARHPLGIKPLGNAFLSDRNDRSTSLGLFAGFEDEFLLQFLLGLVDDPSTLARLEAVSHGMYVFINGTNAIWRDAFLSMFDGKMERWCGSWKRTFVWHSMRATEGKIASGVAALQAPRPKIQTPYIFSDILYHPFRLSMAPLEHLVAPACTFLPIVKLDMNESGSIADFRDNYACKRRPAILMNAMLAQDWPCRDWTMDKLVQLWPNRYFQCEAVKARLPTYLAYSRGMQHLTQQSQLVDEDDDDRGGSSSQTNEDSAFDPFSIPDESPFYLFDASFANDPQASLGWRVPEIFQQACYYPQDSIYAGDSSATRSDLLSLLGSRRPDHRWIIAGPSRSGSGWHKDPNGTSAWNAVLTGRKAWMMLPPHVTPPGVYVSEDEAEVTAPLSIAEWLLDFAEETRRLYGPTASRTEDRLLLEGVCEEGEVLFVPSGWWHLVINLEESVALTQNFVSPPELVTVLDFMKNKADQLSGFKKSQLESCSQTIIAPGLQPPSVLQANEDDDCEDGADFGVFDEFCKQLARFDASLLRRVLPHLDSLETDRLASKEPSIQHLAQRVKASGARSANTWWEQLKKRPDAIMSTKNGADFNASAGFTKDLQFSLSSHLAEEELDELPW